MGSVTGSEHKERKQNTGHSNRSVLKWAPSNQDIPILCLPFVVTFESHQDEERRPQRDLAHFCRLVFLSFAFSTHGRSFYTRRAKRVGRSAGVSLF
jgi:hypothetical protein